MIVKLELRFYKFYKITIVLILPQEFCVHKLMSKITKKIRKMKNAIKDRNGLGTFSLRSIIIERALTLYKPSNVALIIFLLKLLWISGSQNKRLGINPNSAAIPGQTIISFLINSFQIYNFIVEDGVKISWDQFTMPIIDKCYV